MFVAEITRQVTGISRFPQATHRFFLLKHAKELRLHGQGHAVDFVQEQGAVFGGFKKASWDWPSKGTFFRAEQNTLQKDFREWRRS